MSGPKISLYGLSEWQRNNLLEQLKCSQNSIICAERTKQLISELNGLGGQVNMLLETISLANARTGGRADSVNELCDIQRCLAQDCSLIMSELSANMPVPTNKITITEDELNEKKEQLAKLESIQSKAISCRKKAEETLAEISGEAQVDISEIKSGIDDDIAAVSSFNIEPEDNAGDKFADSYKSLESKLRSLSMSADCHPSVKQELLEALFALGKISSIEYLNTFNAVTVIPLLKKYDVMLAQREQRDSLEELKSRYAALCSVAQIQPKVFSGDEAGLRALALETAALEKQIVTQAEQVYISECVSEVMTEMGYDLIGDRSVIKRSGKRFRNELFSYGDGTAINVTYDSEGQIAMELGGIDRTDRLPVSDEVDALCEDMESFCTDFMVFEEKLKAKGVSIRSRISMLPPAAEYATIINIDDYNIVTIKPISDMTIKNKRKKYNTKRRLRREDN